MKQGVNHLGIIGTLAIAYLAASGPMLAQVIPDTTLPVNSRVTPDANTSVITGGTTAGSNLFHSFREFSVLRGNTAYFNNAIDIQNIITRVTGSSISNIDGILKANGGANLFLINPNGIIFGPNASLNIGGSFLASSASSIKFADGSNFDATNPAAPPLLTVSVPIGLQFGPNPGRIVVRGTGNNLSANLETDATITDNRPVGLQVSEGQTLALVGGEVALEAGNITAHSGRIELGSVGASSYVSLNSFPSEIGWSLGYSEVQNFENISLSNAASADVSGNGGGNIQVRSRNLTLSDSSVILALNEGSNSGGKVEVNTTESVELIGEKTADSQYTSNIAIEVQPEATGNGGDLTIETGRLILRDGGEINSGTFGAGRAGNLTVRAKDSIEAIGFSPNGQYPSGLFTQAGRGSTGEGGDLTIETGRLIVRDGAQISAATLGAGRGGTIIVRASDSVEAIRETADGRVASGLFAATAGTGDAGDLTIETGRLIVRDGATVNSSTRTSGKGGNLTVRARDSIELSGLSVDGIFSSRLVASARVQSTGEAGNITVETGQLIIRDKAQINVSSQGTKAAGNLLINAGAIRLDNEGSLTAATGAGGGNITVNSRDIQLRRTSNINTNATGISAGGNITLNTATLAALENSDITANSEESFGGRVMINAQGIFGTEFRSSTSDLTSDITASSSLGAEFSGTVEINTPDVAPAAGLLTLPSGLVDVSRLINSNCEALARGSSFIVTGKGGLPPNPLDPLVSSTVLVDWVTWEGEGEGEGEEYPISKPQSPIVEATGWAIDEKGQVVLIANALSGNSHAPWYQSPSCQNVR